MHAAIVRRGIMAPDVELAQLGKAQVLYPRRGPPQPGTTAVSADFGFEPVVVKHDDLAVTRQVHIQLGSVGPAGDRMFESRKRVFRSKACAPAMSNVEQ
jgi:hypothetical protein